MNQISFKKAKTIIKKQLEQVVFNDKKATSRLILKLYLEKHYDELVNTFERIQKFKPIFEEKNIYFDLFIYSNLLKSLYFLVWIIFTFELS